MTMASMISGYAFSIFAGTVLLWLIIDKGFWVYLARNNVKPKPKTILTIPLGIVERVLYTSCFILNQQGFVAVWLALKVASKLKRWEDKDDRPTYNIFLIGNGLSLIVSFIGAWIAMGTVPFGKALPG